MASKKQVEQKGKKEVKTKMDNLNEDDDNVDLVPKINLKEPEPHDPIWKWAERNIGENPSNKLELIEELRDMIFERGECVPHRTDDAFLMRFLRARHYTVRMAHRLFVNYYTFRENNPKFFFEVDFNKLVDIGEAEIFSVPPYLDEQGRRMLILRIEKWNTAQFTTDELFQAIIFLAQAAVLEPSHQILGGVCLLDAGRIAAGQAWYLTPTVVKHILSIAYTSMPHRIEAFHIINVSKIFDYAFAMLKPFLSDLVKGRIFIHQNLESLHRHISSKYLPKRYGGIHKDYRYDSWLTLLNENDELIDEIESYGYEGGREFLKKL